MNRKPSHDDEHASNVKETPLLSSWSPITTRLLSNASSSSSWNVIDHVVDSATCRGIQTEIQPLLGRLVPAKTTGDTKTEEIFKMLHLEPSSSQQVRGDKSLFLSREFRSDPKFPERYPCLSLFLSKLQNTLQYHLSNALDFDLSLTSVQLAVYPGDGVSGYPRHCDRGANCTDETPYEQAERIVTVVYYLTPEDWDADLDGGCLRLCLPKGNHDIVPYANRMILFRSDQVEHQVLASLRRSRTALTAWFYGKPRMPTNDNKKEDQTPQDVASESAAPPSNSLDDATLPAPLPLQQTDEETPPTIFVSIAAYRDSETGPTIRNLLDAARYPDRVFIGLVLQIDPDEDSHIVNGIPNDTSQIRCLTLHAVHALGPCYARFLAQSLHRKEDYVLQIDSHMRFRKNWDSYLCEQLATTTRTNDILLTTYPVGYQLGRPIPTETRGTVLVPWKFEQGLLRQRGRLLTSVPSAPIPSRLFAAGFNFCRARVWHKCPYDGSLHHLFFGEELTMALRLYTHGVDLYAPPETVCYHLWSRSHRPTKVPVNAEQQRQRQEAIAIVRGQLLGTVTRGLGTVRSVGDFAAALGVDFQAECIKEGAELCGLTHDAFDHGEALSPESLEAKVASLESPIQLKIASFLQSLR